MARWMRAGIEGNALQAFEGIDPSLGVGFGDRLPGLLALDLQEHRRLHGVGALEAPMVFADVADEVEFGLADGRVGLTIPFAVFFEGFLFAGERGVSGCGEAMLQAVLADDLFTGLGDGAGGEFRVGLIGSELRW